MSGRHPWPPPRFRPRKAGAGARLDLWLARRIPAWGGYRPAEKVAAVIAWGMVAAVAVALAVALSGCAAPASTTTTVEVPIPVPCNPPEPAPPSIPVSGLGPDADIFEHVRALWATVERMEGYEAELRAAADSCRGK